MDGQGNVYIADRNNFRVRKVSPGGTITTFAGGGRPGFSRGRRPGDLGALRCSAGVAVDGQGNVYIADRDNPRVRKVSPGGTITTFAGTGVQGFSGDGGPATSAQLYYPDGVAVDGQGNVYIADLRQPRVRKVSPGGTITTFAGTGASGSSGDGGPATSARLRPRAGWRWTGRGTSTSPTRTHRVRKVSPDGTITTFAGTGAAGHSRERRPGDRGAAVSSVGAWRSTDRGTSTSSNGEHRVRKVTIGRSCGPDADARRGVHAAAARPEGHHRHGEVQQALLARRHRLGDDPRHEARVRPDTRDRKARRAGTTNAHAPLARRPSRSGSASS